MVFITAAVSILVTSAVFGLVLWCKKSRKRNETRSESELVGTPDPITGQVPSRVNVTDNSALGVNESDMPHAIPPSVDHMQGPAGQNMRKVNNDLVYEV